jgi:hypothetical protein
MPLQGTLKVRQPGRIGNTRATKEHDTTFLVRLQERIGDIRTVYQKLHLRLDSTHACTHPKTYPGPLDACGPVLQPRCLGQFAGSRLEQPVLGVIFYSHVWSPMNVRGRNKHLQVSQKSL